MPIKLVPPRIGKSPNWTIRGTYLGVRVDQTTGTPQQRIAAKALARIKDAIERGAFSKPGAPTFASAALTYVDRGGEERFVLKLAEHFGDTPLARIDQAAIDAAALALYPRATPATRNRQVYSPVSAILKMAGVEISLKRPKGASGVRRTFWLAPDQAERVLGAATARDAEFGLFLAFLLYTGCRLTEGLGADLESMSLAEGWAYLRETKNGAPRLVHFPPVLVAALAGHPRGLDRKGKLFRFGKNGRLYTWLDEAAKAAGVIIPTGVACATPSGIHGAPGCAAMADWTRRGSSELARGSLGRRRRSMSTRTRRRRRARPIGCRMCGQRVERKARND